MVQWLIESNPENMCKTNWTNLKKYMMLECFCIIYLRAWHILHLCSAEMDAELRDTQSDLYRYKGDYLAEHLNNNRFDVIGVSVVGGYY
jgi:hypothetical protein